MKEPVRTDAAPAPFQGAPYSQAIKANGLVFVSGQLPLDPQHAQIVGDEIGAQTERVFANLRAILEAAGTSLDNVVKTTVFLRNLDDFAASSGAVTSAPVSTTAIVIAEAARWTLAGTRFARVAVNCHSAVATPCPAPTSDCPSRRRPTVLRIQRIPARPRSAPTSVAETSATCRGATVARTCSPRRAAGES